MVKSDASCTNTVAQMFPQNVINSSAETLSLAKGAEVVSPHVNPRLNLLSLSTSRFGAVFFYLDKYLAKILVFDFVFK